MRVQQEKEKDLAYDAISDNWEKHISHYDTDRRIEVLVHDFLGTEGIEGKRCLDVGCGLGYFTRAILRYKPGSLSASDLSPKLVSKLSTILPGVNCFIANILELSKTIKDEKFDAVICSDVIEHTPDPYLAIKNLCNVVKPKGLLSISVPNRRWLWLLILAQRIGLRKHYQGYENWVTPNNFKKWIQQEGFDILRCEGVHTIPFTFFPQGVLRRLDRKLRKRNYSYALNLAILARKK